jgi:hypothetical protein
LGAKTQRNSGRKNATKFSAQKRNEIQRAKPPRNWAQKRNAIQGATARFSGRENREGRQTLGNPGENPGQNDEI